MLIGCVNTSDYSLSFLLQRAKRIAGTVAVPPRKKKVISFAALLLQEQKWDRGSADPSPAIERMNFEDPFIATLNTETDPDVLSVTASHFLNWNNGIIGVKRHKMLKWRFIQHDGENWRYGFHPPSRQNTRRWNGYAEMCACV